MLICHAMTISWAIWSTRSLPGGALTTGRPHVSPQLWFSTTETTYWTLLGNWGVSLKDIAPNGTNDPEVERRNEKAFMEWSPRIHDELLRRAKAAAKNVAE